MENERTRPKLAEVKEWDMVSYLSSLGYEPAKIRGNDYWYCSPLRGEKTPSFKINRQLNRWYDHGDGTGGNLVDFAIRYFDCTIGELLDMLAGYFSFHRPPVVYAAVEAQPENKIEVVAETDLKSHALVQYIRQRRIDLSIAEKYCREVRYTLRERTYFGIGFRNDEGGYEIRNPYIKLSSSPKAFTTFQNGAEEAIVLEGFFDFLSFKTLHKHVPEKQYDFLVLNSLALFEKARPFMDRHRMNRLYLDRDAAGQKCTQYALSLGSHFSDESSLYKNHNDLNDWMVGFGLT